MYMECFKLMDKDMDGVNSKNDLRAAFDHSAAECDITAAGPSTAASFAAAAGVGADIAIVTPDVLRSLLQHPLTDRGLDRFLGAISRRPKGKRGK